MEIARRVRRNAAPDKSLPDLKGSGVSATYGAMVNDLLESHKWVIKLHARQATVQDAILKQMLEDKCPKIAYKGVTITVVKTATGTRLSVTYPDPK